MGLFQINATSYHNFDCLRSFRIVLFISHLMCSFLKQSYTDSSTLLLNLTFLLFIAQTITLFNGYELHLFVTAEKVNVESDLTPYGATSFKPSTVLCFIMRTI